jgi:hypothetical protein
MARFMSLVVGFCAAVLVLGLIGGFLISPTPPATSASTAPALPFPGVARVGVERAQRIWTELANQPSIYSRHCAFELCSVMIDPAAWWQLPYDLRRDVAAVIGIGAAATEGALWTDIVDMYSGKKLAGYSARDDRVDIE